MRIVGFSKRTALMHAAKCAAPPSRRSSRSTEVITTYFRPMSRIVPARCAGSSGSGGFGRPCATSQNEQRRVQTSPRIMKVAVPLPKHSWMFGQDASSQTVTSRFSRSLRLELWRPRCRAGCARESMTGLRSIGASAKVARLRAILSSPSLPCRRASTTVNGIALTESDVTRSVMPAGRRARRRRIRCGDRSRRMDSHTASSPNWRASSPIRTLPPRRAIQVRPSLAPG